MSNPYASYFERLDELVPRLEDNELTREGAVELADLIRRAAFYLASHLNTLAQVSPFLILPVEGEVVAEGVDSSPHASHTTT